MTESNLATKLAAAQKAVGTVQKKGENAAQHYKYARAEDVIAEAHKALEAEGLIVTFEATDVEPVTGGNSLILLITGALVVSDPETGEKQRVPVIGAGADKPGDKAAFKGMTGARKYALIHLLDIAIGDDPEEERQRRGQQRRQQKQTTKHPTPEPENPLPDPRVNKLGQAIGKQGTAFDRLCQMFGSVGAEAPQINRSDSLKKALRALTSEQADQLEKLVKG